MIPSALIKQPWERRRIKVDFSNALAAGDTVASISGVTAWEDSTERTSTVIHGSPTVSGNEVFLYLTDGVDGTTYNIRIRVLTSNGDQIEEDLDLVVREK